ncbi:MAG TPA: MFS transporter [Micromonosporaceae bacterium]|nr:MFS transporter [Micromonosporaceae bacterium]
MTTTQTTRSGWRRHTIDLRPLRHQPYRRLFTSSAASNFGFQFTAVAVPVQMFALTRSSFWVGLIGVAGLLPLLIFGIWGGAVSDAVDRRKLLLASSTLQFVTTLALLVQALLGVRSPELLLVLVAGQAGAFAISGPTRRAMLPRLVSPAELPAANTLDTTMFNGAMVAGPLAAGVLVASAGVGAAYAVDALAFGVVLWATLRLPSVPPTNGGQRAGLRDIKDGLVFIAASPVLLLSFAVDIAAMVLAMPRALFPQVAAERFGGEAAIGWLFSAIAIGSVLAGLTSGWIGRVRRQGLALVLAVVVWGLAVGAAGLAHSLWLAVALLALGGAADLVSAVYRQTILQTYAPDQLQGRLQGVFIAVVAGGPRLGDLRAGTMAAAWGVSVSWAGGGLAAAVVALIVALSFPALLRWTRPEPRPAHADPR